MSGLPPEADIKVTHRHVSFGPKGEPGEPIAGAALHRGTGAGRHERSSDQR